MGNWTEADLQQQYERAGANGWVAFFESSATAHGFAPEFLMGIASRETNMQNIKGDERDGVFHGFGIMQVDVNSFPDFCKSWTPDQVAPSIDFGARVLAANRDFLARRHILDLRSIAASYNTGAGNVCQSYARHRDVDSTTAGKNYGRDVLDRTDCFTKLRAADRPKAA